MLDTALPAAVPARGIPGAFTGGGIIGVLGSEPNQVVAFVC